MNNNPKTIKKLNLFLFLYFCVGEIVSIFFEPDTENKMLWDMLFEKHPILSFSLALLFSIILMLWATQLFKQFWNKIVSDIFNLRTIDFHEALSAVLVFAIIIS